MELDRESLDSLDRLIAISEAKHISFSGIIDALLEFIDVKLADDLLHAGSLTMSQHARIREILLVAKKLWERHISYEKAKEVRYAAWDLYDKAKHEYRGVLRLLIVCLFDQADAEFDAYGVGPVFEVIYSELFEIAPSYCSDFEAFAMNRFA